MSEANRDSVDTDFDRWWRDLTSKGDPMRRPNLVREAFEAGAALWKDRWEAERADHEASIKNFDDEYRHRDY